MFNNLVKRDFWKMSFVEVQKGHLNFDSILKKSDSFKHSIRFLNFVNIAKIFFVILETFFVQGSKDVGYNGEYDLYELNDGQFYYKHTSSVRYIYKSKDNTWFISTILNSNTPKYWTTSTIPDPTIPTGWHKWKSGKTIVDDELKIQRFFKIDPPTPRVRFIY